MTYQHKTSLEDLQDKIEKKQLNKRHKNKKMKVSGKNVLGLKKIIVDKTS